MLIYILGQSVNVLWTSYIMMAAWELFIPITGKTFYENPDTLVALLCGMATIFVFSYLVRFYITLKEDECINMISYYRFH